MRNSKFSESKTATLLKDADVGPTVADRCREHGINTARSHNDGTSTVAWRSQISWRLKRHQEENEMLKRICAGMALENRAMKDPLGEFYGRRRGAGVHLAGQ